MVLREIDDGWGGDCGSTEQEKTDPVGKELLNLAFNGPFEAFKKFLAKNPNAIDAVDSEGDNSVNEAARGGQLEIVRYLVEKKNCELSAPNNNHRNALYWAQKKGHWDILAYLSTKLEDLDFEQVTPYITSAITNACKDKKENAEKKKTDLLEIGKILLNVPDKKNIQDEINKAFMHVASQNWVEHTELYIQCGADLEYKDSHQDTTLNETARLGKQDTFEVLVKHGAILDSPNKNQKTALAWCLERDEKHIEGKNKIAERLIFLGVDITWSCEVSKETNTLYNHILKNQNLCSLLQDDNFEVWSFQSGREVKKVSFINNGKHMLAEIFNFKASERLTIMQNLTTLNESICRDSFGSVADKKDILKAAQELKNQGGNIDMKILNKYQPAQIKFALKAKRST